MSFLNQSESVVEKPKTVLDNVLSCEDEELQQHDVNKKSWSSVIKRATLNDMKDSKKMWQK